MPRVDDEIAQSRARKKAGLKKLAIGSLCIVTLGAVGAVTYTLLPTPGQDAQVDVPQAQKSSSVEGARPIDRAALQQALNTTRQLLEDTLSERLVAWAPGRAENLRQRIDNAYQDYGRGEYAEANAALQPIKDTLATLRKDFRSAYQMPFEQAARAFDKNDTQLAQQLNQQALSVNPDFADAQALQTRLAVFNDVAALYEQARIGKVENNLIKQRDAYARIVELDPLRNDAQSELERLNAQLSNTNFKQAHARAVAAVDAGKLADAQQYLDEAAAIKPQRAELATLQSRIDALVKQQGAHAAEQKIQMFTGLNEWETVKMLADKAIADYPNSAVIRDALDTANAILAAHERLDSYLNAPSRLADNNIRQRAYSALSEVSELGQISSKLGNKADQLERLIEQENIPLAVTVTSDGLSHLKVLGVGHIGEIQQKTIQLKPGSYKLEASREGYRTVIQDLIVQKSALPITVHLVCSEKI